MTFLAHRSARSRHVVLRASPGDSLLDGFAAALADERIACGWFRASGVLLDVELRPLDGQPQGTATPRRMAGPVQILVLEGSIGLTGDVPGFSLRALLAHEGARGVETVAGVIVSARVVTLDAFVTVLEDLTKVAGWSGALAASVQTDPDPGGPRPAIPAVSASAARAAPTAPMPQRPARPSMDLDGPTPEAGDIVDHFAFGRGEVMKSDGDRLHVRVYKDGRVREIALEMLRVSPLNLVPGQESGRHFKLERRI
jgi:predicted DNA-binding protein with PD1-like motif